MSEDAIRVLVADDHAVVRTGIRAFLATEPGIEVVGEAANGREAVDACARLSPDVVLMDLVMPVMDGVEATRRIRAVQPEIEALVLTSFGSDEMLFPALKAGAIGYLLKDASPDDVARAIRNAAEGRSVLHPIVARRLLSEVVRERSSRRALEPLTAREVELLKTLARGLSNEQIAVQLHISEATVRTHISHILAKLDLANRTQAALYALREGLATLDDLGN